MNKINNISFKRAAATPSLLNIEPSNAQKLDVAIEVINKYYPQNDVFLGADEKGELVYQIQKADPSIELFDTDVLTKTRTNPQELLSLINLARLYKTAYNTIHNIKEPVEKYNGYAACPIVTDYGHVLLCEFDYNKEPMISFPFSMLDMSKEQWAAWLLKVYVLKPLYFYGMLKGLA